MRNLFDNIWANISLNGISYARDDREKREIIILNRTLTMLVSIQVACLFANLVFGLTQTANLTALLIAGISIVHILIRLGKINTAKITAILVLNIYIIFMGVLSGGNALIDLLRLTALLPIFFFGINNKKLLFSSMSLSLVPFILYHFTESYFARYALPLNQQEVLGRIIVAEKIFCLATMLYMIYYKYSSHEKEMQEKEAQLIEQKKLYECILEQMPIDIVTFDKQLKYSYLNSKAVKDLNVREWLIGKTNVDYFKERGLDVKIAEERDRVLQDALQNEAPVKYEETFVDRKGKIVHSIKGASPIYSQNKEELLCIVGYSLDITAIKEAEQKLKEYAIELERKNEDLHHFVNATSHDLKTPLRNIASYLQLIEKKNYEILDQDSLSMIAHTIKSVKQLNQLINDIFQYSVADRNDKPAEITDVGAVLEQLLLEMEKVISDRGVVVRFDKLPVIKALPSHVGMIFTNLIGNAIKYNTSLHPTVSITCTETAEEYIIGVADNGIGIEKKYTKKIFEIFRRLHSAEEYEGTGVGLAICNKIAENYGGRIWVESEYGRGSTFYFSLNKEIVNPQNSCSHKIQSYKKFAVAS